MFGKAFFSNVLDKDKPIECGEVFVDDVLSEIGDIVGEQTK